MNTLFRRGALAFSCAAVTVAAFMLFETALATIIALLYIFACVGYSLFKSRPINPKRVIAFFAVCVISASIGVASALICQNNISKVTQLCDEKQHDVSATIEGEIYAESFGSAYNINVKTVDGKKMNFPTQLELGYNGGFEVGDEIGFYGTFELPEDDETSYLKSKNIFVVCSSDGASKLSGGKISVFKRINKFFENAFYNKLTERGANFASAVLLGNRDNVESSVKLDFRRSGLSHILALSGLHLAIISLGVDFLLRRVGLKKQIRTVVMIVLIALFAIVTGLSASVFRSAVMLIIFYIAQLMGEKNDSITALFFALALILCVRPYSVWDGGLLMSFSATFGLVLFSDVLTPKFAPMTRENYSKPKKIFQKVVSYFVELLTAGVVATVFTMPVTYIMFGGVSLISPLANIIVIPIIQLLLYLLLIFCAVCKIPLVSNVIAFLSDALIYLVEKTARAFSSINGVYISIKYPFTPFIIAVFFIVVAVIVFIPKIKKIYVLAATAVMCAVFMGSLGIYSSVTRGEVYAVCVSEKSNDAVGIVYNGENIIVDISSGGFSTLYSAVKETEGRASCEVSAIVLTHLHKNHIHTIEKLSGYIKLDTIIIPTAESESDAEVIRAIALICNENGIKTEYYNRRAESYLDVLDLTLKLPEYKTIKRSTHPIVTFSVTSGGNEKFIYLGSSFWECDELPEYIESPVVFFGIHGPKPKSKPEKELTVKSNLFICSNESLADLFGIKSNIISKNKGKITFLIEK